MLISFAVIAVASLLATHNFRTGHSIEATVCALVAGGFALHAIYLIALVIVPVALFLLKWGMLAAFAFLCGRFIKNRAMPKGPVQG